MCISAAPNRTGLHISINARIYALCMYCTLASLQILLAQYGGMTLSGFNSSGCMQFQEAAAAHLLSALESWSQLFARAITKRRFLLAASSSTCGTVRGPICEPDSAMSWLQLALTDWTWHAS